MDVVILASGAVSLLVPYLAKAGKTISDKVGEDACNIVNSKIETIYESIKKKFIGDDYSNQTLRRLEEKPNDEKRQKAMKSVLEDALADQQFQKTLSQLFTEAKQAGGDKIIQVYESGSVAIGGSTINIKGKYAGGRDIKIERPD